MSRNQTSKVKCQMTNKLQVTMLISRCLRDLVSSIRILDLRFVFYLGFVISCFGAAASFAADPVSQIIDHEINAALLAKDITPSPRAEDAELLRRIHLDVLGRIPTSDETARYLDDNHSDKHHRLIDQLLAHEEMPGERSSTSGSTETCWNATSAAMAFSITSKMR